MNRIAIYQVFTKSQEEIEEDEKKREEEEMEEDDDWYQNIKYSFLLLFLILNFIHNNISNQFNANSITNTYE